MLVKETYLLFQRSMNIKFEFNLYFRPIYVNYEVLCNAFATKLIDFSEAEIYKLRST